MLRDVYQIPSPRVHVILNGVDEEGFTADKSYGRDFRHRIGVPAIATLVPGVVGRLVKDKGHPLLFEAFSWLMKSHTDVILVVVGSGPWEQRYREIGGDVLVLGSLSPAELRGFYNAIDVFVNPTLRAQGLDLMMMEAMMSGMSVMASRFLSIKGSIVVEEEFEFMFAPNVESLTEMLDVAVKEGPAERGRACCKYIVQRLPSILDAAQDHVRSRDALASTWAKSDRFLIVHGSFCPSYCTLPKMIELT